MLACIYSLISPSLLPINIIVNSIYTLWIYIPSIQERELVYVCFQTPDQKRSIGRQYEV